MASYAATRVALRDGLSVASAYTSDRFGRTTQDGELTYGYDANSNRTTIGYPGGGMATYGYDFADRETTLAVTTPEGATPVVTGAAYLPSGPLTELTFGTGAVESHSFDTRYLPTAIALLVASVKSLPLQITRVNRLCLAQCVGK